jgi:DNA-binding MarR family transcriptional regulator
MADDAPRADSQILAQFSQMVRTAIDNDMERVGIHRGQALVLCAVHRREGLTQTELADALAVQGATVTAMLQKLEEADLVARMRDEADQRLVRVFLTAAGRQKEREVQGQLARSQEALLKGLSDDERVLLRQLLEKVMGNIESA